MKIVAVTWNDSHSGNGDWKPLPTAYESCLVTSIGYLQEFDDGVIVTSSYCPNMPESGEYCFGVTHIPKGCIVSVKVLAESLL
jgi:hypothetical protein